jgi:putative sterol carrier protein
MDVSTIESPEQLAGVLEGLDDAGILATVAETGVDTVLDRVFEEMPRRFDPAKAAGQGAVVQWNITGGDGGPHTYVVTIANGSCTAGRGTTDSPDIALTLAIPVFLRLVAGVINGTTAFMSGQLALTGNVMTAMAMQAWFGM